MEAAGLELVAEGEVQAFKATLEAFGVYAVNMRFIPLDHQIHVGMGQRRLLLGRQLPQVPADVPVVLDQVCQRCRRQATLVLKLAMCELRTQYAARLDKLGAHLTLPSQAFPCRVFPIIGVLAHDTFTSLPRSCAPAYLTG